GRDVFVGKLADPAYGNTDREELRLDRRAEPLRYCSVHRYPGRRCVRRAEAHEESEGGRPFPRLPRERTRLRGIHGAYGEYPRARGCREEGCRLQRFATSEGCPRDIRCRGSEALAGRLSNPGLQIEPRHLQSD